MTAMREVGERIPGRSARVLRVHLEKRDERRFVVYVLSDSLRGPRPRIADPPPLRQGARLTSGRRAA